MFTPKGKGDDDEDASSATQTGLHLKVGFCINTLPLPRSQAVRQLLATPFVLEAWLTASTTWEVMAHSLLRQQAYTAALVFCCHALARRDWNSFEKDTWDDDEDDNHSRYMIMSEDTI